MCSIFCNNMKAAKLSKLDPSSTNRYSLRQLASSSAISKASTSKTSFPKDIEVKKTVTRSSNKHLDGIKTIKSKLSCTKVVSTKSSTSKSNGATLLNNNEVKTSSTWGSRYLCYFSGSKSKPSKPVPVVARQINAVTDVKTLEPASKIDLRPLKKRPLVPSPTVGNPSSTNTERQSVKTDRSKQGNPAQLRLVEPIKIMQMQKTTSPVNPPIRTKADIHQPLKDPAPYNLRKRVEKSEVSTDFPVLSQKKEIRKSEGPKASAVPKPENPKGSLIGIQKREIQSEEKHIARVSKGPAAPVKKISTTRTSTPYQTSHDRKIRPSSLQYDPYSESQVYFPSSSEYDPYSDSPIYYVKYNGDEESKWCGLTCILCNKDLSCSPGDADTGCHEDDEFNEYRYQIRFTPQLLPAVDILPCGHAFHTECSVYAIPEEQSTEPVCVLCFSMA